MWNKGADGQRPEERPYATVGGCVSGVKTIMSGAWSDVFSPCMESAADWFATQKPTGCFYFLSSTISA